MIRFFARLMLIMYLVFTLAMVAAKALGRNSHHSILAFQLMQMPGREGESVYIYLVDEGRHVNPTRHAAWDQGIAWSWDGNLLAFSADSCAGICVHNISANETFSIHGLGAPATNQNPIWRPDGSLTYTIIDPDGTVHISTINLESHAIREEMTREVDSPPFSVTAWSADGRYLAAYSYDIFVLDSQTGEMLNITNTRYDTENFPSWSSNGLLAFISHRDGNWVRVMDITTGEDVNLDFIDRSNDFYSEDDPTWLPDGRLSLSIFHLNVNTNVTNNDIYIVDLEHRTIQNATENVADPVYNPSWSADSRWMTFEVQLPHPEPRDIYMLDMLTGTITHVTNPYSEDINPLWSP